MYEQFVPTNTFKKFAEAVIRKREDESDEKIFTSSEDRQDAIYRCVEYLKLMWQVQARKQVEESEVGEKNRLKALELEKEMGVEKGVSAKEEVREEKILPKQDSLF